MHNSTRSRARPGLGHVTSMPNVSEALGEQHAIFIFILRRTGHIIFRKKLDVFFFFSALSYKCDVCYHIYVLYFSLKNLLLWGAFHLKISPRTKEGEGEGGQPSSVLSECGVVWGRRKEIVSKNIAL